MRARRLIWLMIGVLLGGGVHLAAGTALQQVAQQDLNGLGANQVEYQTTNVVRIRSSSDSSAYNRKAMFLFNLASLDGRDLTDQYIHSASFRVVANERCDERLFRLYGFTDTAGANDSSWHESIEDQSHPDWPVVYNGREQYPAGNGVRWLDTREGPGVGLHVAFSSNLLDYVRWAVGRQPEYGHSPGNPDGKITLLLAAQTQSTRSSYYYARESSIAAYRPVLMLDVRFPVLGMTVAGGTVTNQATYDFGTFANLPGEVLREWILHNSSGEALSRLHVTSIELTGDDAWAFGLDLPGGEDFDLNQGEATAGYAVRFDPQGVYGVFEDARVIVISNDPNQSPWMFHLRAAHQPGLPQVQLTDPAGPTNVFHEVTDYLLRGTATNVVGSMQWINSLGGSGSFPAPDPADPWEVLVPLHVGANILTVTGTNEIGAVDSDSVSIARESDAPFLAITNPAGWFLAVSNATDSYTVGGIANRYVEGEMTWSGPDGAQGTFPAAADWTVPVPLVSGWNDFRFTASNAAGQTMSADVAIVRQPPGALAPGDLMILGWSKNPLGGPGQTLGSDFQIGAMTDIPAGTVVYFTDNGCFADGRFLHASEGRAAGMEHLCALAFRRAVPAGRLWTASMTSDDWTWIFSGRIAQTAPEPYSRPRLDALDQLYAFQSDGPNPLFRPRNWIAVLDDTGGFEEPVDMQTGNAPPGLVEGETALSFTLEPPLDLLQFDFNLFPEWMQMRPQWMNLFAEPGNWRNEPVGFLVGGRFWIGELAMIDLAVDAKHHAVSFSCAYPERVYHLWATTNLVFGPPIQAASGIVKPGRNTEEVPHADLFRFYWAEVEEDGSSL